MTLVHSYTGVQDLGGKGVAGSVEGNTFGGGNLYIQFVGGEKLRKGGPGKKKTREKGLGLAENLGHHVPPPS